MSKVLLKHAAVKSSKKYQADVARMVNITIAVQASSTPTIEMISVRELHAREDNNRKNKHEITEIRKNDLVIK